MTAGADLAELWGLPATSELVGFADGLPEELGELLAFETKDWLPGAENAAAFMLREWFRRAALVSGTVPLGCTGDGDIWLFEAAPAACRVFLLNHELDELELVADSIAAFEHGKRARGAWDDMRERWDATEDLRATLWFGRIERLAGRHPITDDHPATAIARAFRAFLHGDSARAPLANARIVRDVAVYLDEKSHVAVPERLAALGTVER